MTGWGDRKEQIWRHDRLNIEDNMDAKERQEGDAKGNE